MKHPGMVKSAITPRPAASIGVIFFHFVQIKTIHFSNQHFQTQYKSTSLTTQSHAWYTCIWNPSFFEQRILNPTYLCPLYTTHAALSCDVIIKRHHKLQTWFLVTYISKRFLFKKLSTWGTQHSVFIHTNISCHFNKGGREDPHHGVILAKLGSHTWSQLGLESGLNHVGFF